MQWTFFEVATLVAVCSTLKKGLNSSKPFDWWIDSGISADIQS